MQKSGIILENIFRGVVIMKKVISIFSVVLLFVIIIIGVVYISPKGVENTVGTLTLSILDSSTIEGDLYVFIYNRSGGLSSICLREENGYKETKTYPFDEYWINEVSNSDYDVEGYILKDAYFELTNDNPIVSVVIDVKYSEPVRDEIVKGSDEDNMVFVNSTEEVEAIEKTEEIVDEQINESIEDVKEPIIKEEEKHTEEYKEIEKVEEIEEVKGISYPISYTDDTATITIYKEWYEKAWCYIAHLEFTDYNRFGTYCANGKYNNGYQKTSNAAEKIGAIFCVNGCYSAPYLEYGVIRSGVVCNDKKYGYVAGYSNVSGIFGDIVKDKYNGPSLTELAETGVVTDTFCFGPAILVDGTVLENKDTSRAQRTFIGSNGDAGDIWIVVSDGRYNDDESAGLTYMECAQLLLNKGCTYGIPLDGGGSSTMFFQGEVLNANGKNERAVVDFIYFK